jgi:hypothetical protein
MVRPPAAGIVVGSVAMSAEPVDVTSTSPLEDIAAQHVCVAGAPGPYATAPTSALGDTLEAQFERGEPLEPLVVFELLDRVVRAEAAAERR